MTSRNKFCQQSKRVGRGSQDLGQIGAPSDTSILAFEMLSRGPSTPIPIETVGVMDSMYFLKIHTLKP